MKFTDSKAAVAYECPISLSPLYCPISIKGSKPKRSFSGPIITELTKTSKVDPLTGQSLEPGWKLVDTELDKEMASQMAVIPMTFSGKCIYT